ncbi:MAG: FAD-dependent oxidoreductase [Pseudomonadota bacterium]
MPTPSNAWPRGGPAENYDVVVVGSGFAGLASAIAAHDAGARVLIVEKMPFPGGISILAGGGICTARDADAAFAYLVRTCAGTTPDDVLRSLADGMADIDRWIAPLAAACGAEMAFVERTPNYPFPGRETFRFLTIANVPGFDRAKEFPHAQTYGSGPDFYKVMLEALRDRAIELRLSCPAERLVADPGKVVRGVDVVWDGQLVSIHANRGVVLACGGFEASSELQAQFWQGKPVLPSVHRGNTGDGIRMAQDLGASLWHMWHYHGSYGFRHTDPDYDFGIRTKKLPDYVVGEPVREGVTVPWILLDKRGHRFMNEHEPYLSDTGHRPLERFDPVTQDFPRIPCWMLLDDAGRQRFPLGQPCWNDDRVAYSWSSDNSKEIENGILRECASLNDVARCLRVETPAIEASVNAWNTAVDNGADTAFGRPAQAMLPIRTPPYYVAEIWPIVSNTQGGPVHDARQRVINAFGEPIERLYVAGELGSVFGHLYASGGNLAECFVGGRTAGTEAARS